jgi:hypothetical protein
MLYEEYSVDTPFVKQNYKDVLIEMYAEGIIGAVKENGKPLRRGSFAEHVKITFSS